LPALHSGSLSIHNEDRQSAWHSAAVDAEALRYIESRIPIRLVRRLRASSVSSIAMVAYVHVFLRFRLLGSNEAGEIFKLVT
jgi:hypothetical protein